MEKWIEIAKDTGFAEAALVDPAALLVKKEVRDMCASDKCGAYDHNWTCPPNCGTLEECSARIAEKKKGILVQTVAELEDSFDIEGMQEASKRHLEHFHELADKIRKEYPDALCLGSGGCRICEKCAHPEPCRFPERACSSMEAYGLLVADACTAAGVPYYHGPGTLAYTACYLV